jgi:hypothetical protein
MVCAEYFHSRYVVLATIQSERHRKASGDADEGTLYTLLVDESLKGTAPKELKLLNENNSGRLTIDLAAGEHILLFALPPGANGWVEADGCGNTAEANDAGQSLRQIKDIRAGTAPTFIFVDTNVLT